MSKRNYWEKRLQEQADILFNKSALDIDKELAFKYRQALNETLDDITDLWDKLQKEQADGQVRPNDLYRYNRYFVIKNNINDRLKRLGLAELDDDVLTVEKKLMKEFPKDKWSRFHHQLVLFGRYKCKAKNPECMDCPFKEFCKENKSK